MNKRIYLCLAHMSGKAQAFIQEAFDTNWVVPLGPNVNGFEEDLKHFVGNNAVSYQKRPQPQSHIPYRHIRIMGRQYHANDSHHRIVMGGAITVCFIIVDPLTETQGEQYRRAQNEDQP